MPATSFKSSQRHSSIVSVSSWTETQRRIMTDTTISVVSSFVPASLSPPVQLTLFSFCRNGVPRISATTQRVKETRPCWRTYDGQLNTKCRFGRAPWLVTAASVLQPSSIPCLMVRKTSCLFLKRDSHTHTSNFFSFTHFSFGNVFRILPCKVYCHEYIAVVLVWSWCPCTEDLEYYEFLSGSFCPLRFLISSYFSSLPL